MMQTYYSHGYIGQSTGLFGYEMAKTLLESKVLNMSLVEHQRTLFILLKLKASFQKN